MKIKALKFWENLPITAKITLWYTTFVIIIMSVMLTISFTIASRISKDGNQKELIDSVNEMITDDDFEEFDDGIYFVKYNNEGVEAGGISPKGFDLTLKLQEDTISVYNKNDDKFYYYDKKINNPEGDWIRGIVPVRKLSEEVNKLFLIVIILSPVLLAIIIYGGYKIIKKALDPVAEISNTALEIQKNGDFSKRINIDEGKDEIHKMATTFNEMLNSLENFYLREKQFSSDVSHELRTPISVILTESQYSLKYVDNMEEAKDSFSVIQR